MQILDKLHVNNVLKSVYISLHMFKDNYMTWDQALYKREDNVIIILKLLTNYNKMLNMN